MKSVKIIILALIFIFATYLVGSNISNLQNLDKKYDAQMQPLLTEWNGVANNLLELCTTSEKLGDLQGCKTDIQKLKDQCSDIEFSTTDFCLNGDFERFYTTIDERLIKAEEKVEALKKQISILENQLDSIPSEITTQIPLSNEQQAEYARIIRDCSRDNEIIAKEYLSKFANVDSLTDNQEESIQSNSERISICSADIREIESDYCDLFNPSCTETGRFEMYWDSVSKIQSAYEQICATTGKFCGYTFHGP